MPSFTFYASAEAIPPTGATPVFCDIDPDTYCVTAETVRAALTPRTKAVIAVHLFGNVAPVAEIEALGRAGARGRRPGGRLARGRRRGPGALGTAATFSFFPSKNLGCFGDGGMITTSRRRRSPSARARCASTARATRSPTSRSATTRAWTSCRRRSCACSCRTSTAGPTAAGAPARHYEQAGLGELVALPRPVAGLRARVAPVRGQPSRSVEAPGSGAAPRPAIGCKRLLPHARPPPAADARVGARASSCPGTEQAAAHAPGDPDEPGAHPRAGREVVAAAGSSGLPRGSLSASARAGPRRGTSRTTRAGTPITTARGGHVAGDERARRHERLLADLHARRQHGAAADAAGAPQQRAAQRRARRRGGPSCRRWS